MVRPIFCCLVVCHLACSAAAGEPEEQRLHHWHQWRGPLSTGVAPHGDPPTEWSQTKNIQWKAAIPGRGSASPIVWGDRIFILSAIQTDRMGDADRAAVADPAPVRLTSNAPDADHATTLLSQRDERGPEAGRPRDGGRRGRGGFGPGFGGRGFGDRPANVYQFVVLCLDRQTGRTIWERTAVEAVPHEGHHQTGNFAPASPVTDGRYLYASFGSRGIYCYDVDGNLLWDRDLGDMQIKMNFGEGSSPALHQDTLLVNWDHEGESFIVALDAHSGKEKWRQDRDEPSTWGTPLVVEGGGRTQVVTTGPNRVRSYDFHTGEPIWQCGGLGSNPIATPVPHEGLVIVMSGHHDPAGFAVPLSAKGDVTGSDVVAWQIEGSTPYVATPVLYDDVLYFTKGRVAILSVVDATTGRYVINQRRLPNMESIYSSPVAANGRIYISSREGVTHVLQHGPTLEILATNELDETIDASPAIVGNQLILRGEEHLYCIAEDAGN